MPKVILSTTSIAMFLKITISVLLSVGGASGQSNPVTEPNNDTALWELEEIILESEKVDDKLARVQIKARAAALVTYFNPTRAEAMFTELWNFINQSADKDFDKDQARLLALAQIFSRNPKLARRLLAPETDLKKPSPSIKDDKGLNSRAMARLASQLADSDPSAAAGLLEQSLPNNPGPAGIAALTRLREKDSILADYVAAKTLEALSAQPTLVSLPALHLMAAYVFPGADAPISLPDAALSLQTLQYRYFLTGYEVLKASLKESSEVLVREQRYSPGDLQYRASTQAQIAAILAALAPRLQPFLMGELNAINGRLAANVPPAVAEMAKFSLARLSGSPPTAGHAEEALMFALMTGKFAEAREQLARLNDEKKKEMYTQLILKNEVRFLLSQSELMRGLTVIRKLEDQTTRLVMYLEALKASQKARNFDVAGVAVNEARLLIPQTNRNGLHVRALLAFVPNLVGGPADTEAFTFLSNAVTSINALPRRKDDVGAPQSLAEAAMSELNDPMSLLGEPAMEQAFMRAGLVDLDQTLTLAKRIEPRAVQLVARLETVQGVFKRTASERKAPAKPTKALGTNNNSVGGRP